MTIVLTGVFALLASIAGGWFGARQGGKIQAKANLRIAAETREEQRHKDSREVRLRMYTEFVEAATLLARVAEDDRKVVEQKLEHALSMLILVGPEEVARAAKGYARGLAWAYGQEELPADYEAALWPVEGEFLTAAQRALGIEQ
ncbi:hypothetical protein [Streptomyces lavendofoliae]|uniref:hypothetical protein n=1 Tax=Streptomyces lavendofoliae TaxID=67314 RepID=UPI003D89D75E